MRAKMCTVTLHLVYRCTDVHWCVQVAQAVLNGTVPFEGDMAGEGTLCKNAQEFARWMSGDPYNTDLQGRWADNYTMYATSHVLGCNILLVSREKYSGPDEWNRRLGTVLIQPAGMYDPSRQTVLLWHTGKYGQPHYDSSGTYETAGVRNKFHHCHFILMGVKPDGVAQPLWALPAIDESLMLDILVDVATALIHECDAEHILTGRQMMCRPEFRLMFGQGMCLTQLIRCIMGLRTSLDVLWVWYVCICSHTPVGTPIVQDLPDNPGMFNMDQPSFTSIQPYSEGAPVTLNLPRQSWTGPPWPTY
jgi:hypothetical protein